MKILSLAIVLSSIIIGGSIFYVHQLEQKAADKENIFKITESGNLVRFNKNTLQMTVCGLSGQKYRCLSFENETPE